MSPSYPCKTCPAGQVVHGSGPALGLRAILRFIQGIINFVLFFFRVRPRPPQQGPGGERPPPLPPSSRLLVCMPT